MNELVPINDAVDGEIVDEVCGCGKPGRLMVDPYDQDVNNRTVMIVLCGDCEREISLDI